MRAVTIRAPGGPEVLELREVPEPRVPAFHVGVRVRAVGVNRADLLQRAGHYPAPAGVPADVPGLELVGEIDELGEGATARALGERVYGLVAGGAYAERVVMHEREAVPVPEGLGDVEAAAVPEAFVTALDALTKRARLAVGEQVLVHAAGSGVGTAAVQVAKALGCNVTGTSRTAEKLERARELGLDVALHVPSNDALEATLTKAEPFDVALDLVGGPYLPATLPAMASKGRVVLVGLTGGPFAGVNLATVLTKRLTIVGTVLRSRPLEEKIQAADLLRRTLTPWLGRGKIKPVVERTFAFADAPDAHRLVASNATFGKVLLSMTT